MKQPPRWPGLALGALTALLAVGSSANAAPYIRFTDLQSGPNAGGQNNKGVFVTIFGVGFGATQGTSTVTVGGGPVDNYPLWSDTKVIVQLGAQAATGQVVVSAAGVASNGVPFTVRGGNIYFVATTGSDSANGSFASPWATLIKAHNSVSPGDTIYAMNGVSQTTLDLSNASNSPWRSAILLRGSGTATNPIAMVAYPGATVTIGSPSTYYAFRAADGDYWVLSGMVLRGSDVGIEATSGSRYVGNDLSCPQGQDAGACVDASDVLNTVVLGNVIHDSGVAPAASKLYHAIYFSTNSNHIEVGFNTVQNNHTCYSIQFHSSNGTNQFDLHVHDNLIFSDNCAAINFATVDPSQGIVEAYNNVIYNMGDGASPPDGMTGNGCLYVPGFTNFGADGTGTVDYYNNTCYNVGSNTDSGSGLGAILRSAGTSPGLVVRLRNNITYLVSGQKYIAQASDNSKINGSNNLWFGVGAGPSFLQGNINADPMFVDISSRNLRLQAGSPAIHAGVSTGLQRDFDSNPRPAVPSVGAFEGTGGGTTAFLSISGVTVQDPSSGTATATFPVSLSASQGQAVTVSYATSNGTAVAGQDYTATSGSLTIPAGSTSSSVNVSVLTESAPAPSKAFSVTLSNPTNASISTGQATGTILDSTPPSVTVSVGNASATHTPYAGGTAVFNVKLSAASTKTVGVNYATANVTALAGKDYTAEAGSVSFAPGVTSQSVSIPVLPGTMGESSVTFDVNLSAATGASLGTAQGVGTIKVPGTTTGTKNIVWTRTTGVSVSGNSLTKTAAAAWGNAGPLSTQYLVSGDGYVQFTASELTTSRVLGFTHADAAPTYTDINFGLLPAGNGVIYVYENGVFINTFGAYKTGDLLKVQVTGGVVQYARNGSVFYTSTLAPAYPLVAGSALYNQGATLMNAVISGKLQ